MDAWARQEMVGAVLPDRRYLESVTCIVERLAEAGGASYSQALGHGGRQAARRLFKNPTTTVDGLLQGHYEQTAARCSRHSLVLAVQDTTTLSYTAHRSKTGLGPVDPSGKARGMLAHSVLALSPEGQPLGLLDVALWVRDDSGAKVSEKRRSRVTEEKESHKWIRGLQRAQQHVPPAVQVLMVQDREGDVFAFFAAKRRSNVHLLVRAAQPRNVLIPGDDAGERRNLLDAAASAPEVASITVTVPRQANRTERNAVLTVRSTCATVLPPRNQTVEKHPPQDVYLVNALETNPPEGETPLHWVVLTTMPAVTPEAACQMLRFYALRWTIERLHYVLKSGCGVERVQIDEPHRLRNALAIYFMVAWRLLAITYMARTAPDTPADTILSSDEAQVLAAATNRPVRTVAEAVLAIAILGGHEHYRNAPPPGPKRLWLGIRKLEAITLGWILATNNGT